MNDIIDLLGRRRSVPPHLLGGPGPSPEEVERMLTIASRVPDHGKLTPCLADEPGAGEERAATERQRLARAPLVIAVVSRAKPHVKIPEWEQVLSAGAVCMSLVVAANAMGYATSWLTEWYAFDRRILESLGLAPDETIAAFIHIGRPEQQPADRPRPNLADIVTYL
jgi:nitroreductase